MKIPSRIISTICVTLLTCTGARAKEIELYDAASKYVEEVTPLSGINLHPEARSLKIGSDPGWFSLDESVTVGTTPHIRGGSVVEGNRAMGIPARIGAESDLQVVLNGSQGVRRAYGVFLFDVPSAGRGDFKSIIWTGKTVPGNAGSFRWAILAEGALFVSEVVEKFSDREAVLQLDDLAATGWVKWNPLEEGATPRGKPTGEPRDIDFNDAYKGPFDAQVDVAKATSVGFVWDVELTESTNRLWSMERFAIK